MVGHGQGGVLGGRLLDPLEEVGKLRRPVQEGELGVLVEVGEAELAAHGPQFTLRGGTGAAKLMHEMMHRKRVLSATEARVHFGEVLRRVEEGEVIVVEGRGRPQAVILSVKAYARLTAGKEDPLEALLSFNRAIRARLGRPLTPLRRWFPP